MSSSENSAAIKINIDKLLAAIAVISLLVALIIIAITPPASGYEISIYDAYPIYFWLCILVSIACSIIIIVHQSFSRMPSQWWVFGFITILAVNAIILLLPFIRGYLTLGRGDVLTHIGMAKDILFTGHFPSAGEIGANYYPVIHIIVADSSLLTGLTPELLAELIPGLFTLFYMNCVYLLGRQISLYKGQTLLIAVFGSLLLFNHGNLMLAPSVECFLLFPMIVFLFVKTQMSTNKLEYTALLLLILLLIPLIHPGEGSLFLTLTFICFGFSQWLYKISRKHFEEYRNENKIPQDIRVFFPSLIVFIAWFLWLSSFSAFTGTINKIWNWLVNEMGTTTFENYTSLISRANLSIIQFTDLFIKMWGHALIYCCSGILCVIFIWRRDLFRKNHSDSVQFTFSFMFIVFIILLSIAFFTNFLNVDYNREMIYVIFVATILSGMVLYSIFLDWHRLLGIFLISSILIIVATIGLFNTFPSPIVRDSNSQVTNMEMAGMNWFLSHREESLLIEESGISQKRFADAIYGTSFGHNNILYRIILPDHFGYPDNNTFGDSYNQNRYYIENKLSRIAYPEIFPEYKNLWKFTRDDFYKLDTIDSSVSKIFTDGEFWSYYVSGMKENSP